MKIQKIFTIIRNALNDREDELLLEIDKKYDNMYFNEDIIKQTEKLPNKIKNSLEKGKIIENEWNENNNKLNSLIHDCINIENNINDINIINCNIKKYNDIKKNLIFIPEENDINSFINTIKTFGKIEEEDDIYEYIRIIKNQLIEYKNINIKHKLIYDAKRDGQNYANCHSKCNNVPNTFSLVTTHSNKKFGLFRSIPINGDGPWRSDNKAFFISYDKGKIYRIKNNSVSIAFDNECFIQTKSFALSGNILSNNYNSINKDSMNTYFEGFTENYELTCGESNFTVKKFEVFQLEF